MSISSPWSWTCPECGTDIVDDDREAAFAAQAEHEAEHVAARTARTFPPAPSAPEELEPVSPKKPVRGKKENLAEGNTTHDED